MGFEFRFSASKLRILSITLGVFQKYPLEGLRKQMAAPAPQS